MKQSRGKWKARTYSINEEYFSRIDTKEKAYWLGFVAADGNVSDDTRYCLQIGLAEQDIGHLEKFCLAVGFNGPIRIRRRTEIKDKSGRIYQPSSIAHIAIHSKRMIGNLSKLGIVPRKTPILKPWRADDFKLQCAWWRGYIDGDGFIQTHSRTGRPKPRIGCASSYSMVEAFIAFVHENTASRFANADKKPIRNNGCYAVYYAGTLLVQQIIRLLYTDASVFLDRKKERADIILKMDGFHHTDLRAFTRDVLLKAKEEAGTWENAAALLGINFSSLFRLLRRYGLTSRRPRGKPYSSYSREAFIEARNRLGSWKHAAIAIGLPIGSIADARRHFGLLGKGIS